MTPSHSNVSFYQAEEQKHDISARLELLKREKHDFSGAENLLAEVIYYCVFFAFIREYYLNKYLLLKVSYRLILQLRTGILNYENGRSTRITNT